MRPILRLLAAVLLGLAAAGCGAGGEGSALVDPEQRIKINSLDVEPDTGALLLTTNRGFFRITGGRARRVRGAARTPDGVAPVGTFLAVKALGGKRLLGSGHPDRKGRLADFLGLLSSDDGGRSWQVLSRYGLADLHIIHLLHGRVYAYDAVLPGLLVSSDRGRSWSERGTPPGVVLDLVVDPRDPKHVLAANDKEVFSSTDMGGRWRSVAAAPSARLAWPRPDALYRADSFGRVHRSGDNGETWDEVGRIDGEPWKLKAVGPEDLYAALSDATVVHSRDGGRSWEERFEP